MSNKRHIEPLLWSLFGAGGTTIAFFFPALILVILGVSLGMIPAEALSYDRMSAFFLESWIGKLALMVALVPSYWACIHRISINLNMCLLYQLKRRESRFSVCRSRSGFSPRHWCESTVLRWNTGIKCGYSTAAGLIDSR